MRWLRAQRTALTALMFTAIAVAGVYLWLEVSPVTERHRLTIVPASDGSAEIAGQELTVESTRWDEFDSPPGTRSVSIRVHASGGADAMTCGPFMLTEATGGRTWLDADDVLDVPYEEGESSCLEDSAPYDIISVFVVPEDAVGPFHLDVAGEGNVVARFDVEL